ncbi:SusC/RagA family TonB-linked outer membrane protein [Sphingobacterium alkalisoli]|uniref:SusC/RagA family TonB-linked outer membrane protein n=1 Tax=Sphingobacterium alkalisoli TaxID=1874115 RepID=A0A4V5LYX5_9SPHI|nr:SusC/RagA family TonB-linked outer membrane protein [Sphingobacterium alkalisoli]TJY67699.1 SusC/RagA family TonB-linked outer membrane protein [Sphingobacterium alkalisoli]GGH11904.1 SusC/RagA family TonB-linked outer membrane protein [Sphingobacterium alkalisoli]
MNCYKKNSNSTPRAYGLRFAVLILLFVLFSDAQAQSGRILGGAVRSAADGQTIEGVSIFTEKGREKTSTDRDGKFSLRVGAATGILHIRHIGFAEQKLGYDKTTSHLEINLIPAENQIEEVEVVSTGYQSIPKERATGSFVQIDNELLNRRVSTNIIDRLDGMAPGLITNLDRKQRGQGDIEIRGRSTLYSNSEPLIVLDDFPFEGSLESINPNDVENITILKDAAAASIWGVRASNGVIVITTKSGKQGRQPVIEFNTNMSLAGKRNVFDQPMLSSSEFIDIERFLFGKGRYNSTLNTGWQPVSPVVEILAQMRAATITEQDGERMLATIAGQDARGQYNTYFNQPLLNQQYNASARGATDNHDYFISAGMDRNKAQTVGNSFERWALQAANTLRFWENRIKLSHRILYSNKIDRQVASSIPSSPKYPYSQYIDADGNHLPEVSTLRLSYIDGLSEERLLDWQLRPMDDLHTSDFYSNNRMTNLRNSLQIEANIINGLKASALYLYEESYSDAPTYYGPNSYYTRNQTNSFSYLNSSGNLEYGIPLGAIKLVRNGKGRNQTGRLQVEYDRYFGNDQQFNMLAGAEIRENSGLNASYGWYGYNEENQTNQNHLVNYLEPFRMWHSGQSLRIPTMTDQSSVQDRFVSYYTNIMYAFKDRYRLSASLRRDGSNLFGVDANQKFIPLWSIGGLWDIHKETFFPQHVLSKLQLRTSYGYNGNLNRSVSGYLTARQGTFTLANGQPYYEIVNPPNPALRWEKVRNINVGVDLTSHNQRISATAEYWQKRGQDLIANRPTPTQVGVAGFTGNTASTLSKGIDVSVQSRNLTGRFSWSSQAFISRVTNRVLDYHIVPATNFAIMSGINDYPQIDHPQFAFFAFPMKGLDETGDPIGYLGGQESKDYRAIKNTQDLSEMEYMGTSVPTFHGTLWNSFSYSGMELSFSLRWYAGHVFRRNSLDNASIYNGSYTAWDYQQRWQNPGDENSTDVPALVYPNNVNRSDFYKYSGLLIEPADHLRFQDLQFAYNAVTFARKLSVEQLRLILSATDIGVLWTRNNKSIDPVFFNGNTIRTTYSLGIQIRL